MDSRALGSRIAAGVLRARLAARRALRGGIPRTAWALAAGALGTGAILGLRAPVAPVAAIAPATTGTMDGAALADMERRVAALEGLLGDGTTAGRTAPGRTREEYETLRLRVEALASRGDASWAHLPTLMPVSGGVITSPYTEHRFHPIRHRDQPHYGVDIGAPLGSPIRATADGVVAATANSSTYGLGVDVNHGNGFITRYAHASRIAVVVGQAVRRGDVIAYVGSTGLSTGPHCHYEIFHNGWSVDPLRYLMESGLSVDASALGGHD